MITSNTGDIFVKMEAAGINPDPLLETAANDIINLYGDDAADYAHQIHSLLISEKKLNSAKMWNKLSEILVTLVDNKNLLRH